MLLFQSTCSFNGVSICKANKWLNISFKFIVKQYTAHKENRNLSYFITSSISDQ
ncbi:Uncharacterised protein [Paenibacillus thiaminolyticus]|nr:Uncharacterised protein [Paenibacillus thiaminolyticus]